MSTTIGVDIGFETVKIVGLEPAGKRWKLRGMALVHTPSNSWKIDTLDHIDELAKLINDGLKNARPHPINGKRVMIALPESVIFSSTFSMPEMKDAELKKALPFEIADKLSIEIDDYYYDYEEISSQCRPIPVNETLPTELADKEKPSKDSKNDPEIKDGATAVPQITVFCVATKKTLVDSVMELCKKADLELAGIDIKPGAIARAVVKQNDKKARVIVDLGVGGTGASIADGQSLRVTSTVPWGTNSIGDQIVGPVENLREKASPVFDELVHITKFFENRVCPGVKIEELLISGTGANIPNVVEVFQQETGLPTKLADPFALIDTNNFPIPKQMVHPFSDAVGLAMRHV